MTGGAPRPLSLVLPFQLRRVLYARARERTVRGRLRIVYHPIDPDAHDAAAPVRPLGAGEVAGDEEGDGDPAVAAAGLDLAGRSQSTSFTARDTAPRAGWRLTSAAAAAAAAPPATDLYASISVLCASPLRSPLSGGSDPIRSSAR